MGRVGPLVWWARGSGGPVGLMGPWVWWILLIAKSPTLRGPTCQGVLGLVQFSQLSFNELVGIFGKLHNNLSLASY